MRLADLRVVTYDEARTPHAARVNHRPATVADLVAALIEEGAETLESNNAIEIGWFNREPRRYLVFRIPEDAE